MIVVYSEQELRRLAQRHPAWNGYWSDLWFEQNRQPDDRYIGPHRAALEAWLIRFANWPAPRKEKV